MISSENLFARTETVIKFTKEIIEKLQISLNQAYKPIRPFVSTAYEFVTQLVTSTISFISKFLSNTAKFTIFAIEKAAEYYQFINRKLYVRKILSARSQWYQTKRGDFYNPKLKATISPRWKCSWNLTRSDDQLTEIESKEQAQDIAFKMWMKGRLLRKRLDEHNLSTKIPITLTQKIIHNERLSPNKVLLRDSVVSDIPELLTLMEQIGCPRKDPAMRARITTYLEKANHHILIATKGKAVVGFIAFVIYDLFLLEGKRCRIEGMIVDANQQDLSVKRKLMQAAELFARDHEGKVIDLIDGMCRTKDGTHDFYKFLGYNSDGSSSKTYLRKEL